MAKETDPSKIIKVNPDAVPFQEELKEYTASPLTAEMLKLLCATTMGLDTRRIPLPRFVTCRIFFDVTPSKDGDHIFEAVKEAFAAMGFHLVHNDRARYGTWQIDAILQHLGPTTVHELKTIITTFGDCLLGTAGLLGTIAMYALKIRALRQKDRELDQKDRELDIKARSSESTPERSHASRAEADTRALLYGEIEDHFFQQWQDGKADQRVVTAAKEFLMATAMVQKMAVQLADLAVIKYSKEGQPTLQVKHLSRQEQEALARNPDLLRNPEKLMEEISIAVRSFPIDDDVHPIVG